VRRRMRRIRRRWGEEYEEEGRRGYETR